MVMEHLEGLNILNDCRENTKLLRKLPEYLQSRWTRRVANENVYPSFSQFAFFVTKEADIVCNPVLCKSRPDNSEGKKRYTTEEHNKGKYFPHRALASQTVAQKVELLCEGCNRPNHTLERCWSFISKSSDEKRELILKKGICFSGLKKGHKLCIVQLNSFVESVNNNIQHACMKTWIFGSWLE